MSIFDTPGQFGDEGVIRNFLCAEAEMLQHMVYRRLPTETTSESTPSATSAPTTSTPTNSTTASTDSNPSPQPRGDPNMAWVAGAVIGPVAVILALVLGFWLCRRRKAKKTDEGQVTNQAPAPGVMQPYNPVYYDGQPWMQQAPYDPSKPGFIPHASPDPRFSAQHGAAAGIGFENAVEIGQGPGSPDLQEMDTGPRR